MLIGDDEDDVGCSAFRLAGPAGGDLRERFACPQRNGGGEERQQQFATLHASRAHYLPSSNSGSAILATSSAGSFEPARAYVSKRSEGGRVGKECVRTCSSRWVPDHSKQTNTKRK